MKTSKRSQLMRQRPLLSREEVRAEAVFVALQRAATCLARNLDEALKPFGLTTAQYAVLRVLRDRHEEGVSCSEIARTLITHDPDITRLSDRLAERGLLCKERSQADRRVVTIALTDAGLELVAQLDALVAQRHVAQLAHLQAPQLDSLRALLEQIDCGQS